MALKRIFAAEEPSLFNPKTKWEDFVDKRGPVVEQALKQTLQVLTAYGRDGIQTAEDGRIHQTSEYEQWKVQHESFIQGLAGAGPRLYEIAQEAGEAGVTPSMTPNFFTSGTTYRPTTNLEPDTSYLDWVVQRQMQLELEDRKEWNFDLDFVRMDQHGQIQYGKFTDTSASSRNYEWGAGIKIFRTWFETNVFGIKMNTLAPKVRFAYFDKLIANSIYATLQSAITTLVAAPTNNVIRDINAAMAELSRYTDFYGNTPFANGPFRIIAPPEAAWWLNAALAMSYALLSRETLTQTPRVTYTTKLPAGNTIYVIADKFEQNELGTRVPFGVFGQTTDIDVFADKIAYRGAWGFQMSAASGRKIVINPAIAGFAISAPLLIEAA